MGKAIGILVLLGVVGIAFMSYSQMYNSSSNLTLWSPLVQSAAGVTIPTLLAVVVVVILIMGLFVFKKR
jgi:hypothetical protein